MPNERDDAKRKREAQRHDRADKKSEGQDKKSDRQDEKSREISAVVDRIEDGDVAVLSLGDGKRMIDLPLSRLPEGVEDGDHLRLTFDGEPSEKTFKRATQNRQSRAEAGERVRKLQERLANKSGPAGKKDFKL